MQKRFSANGARCLPDQSANGARCLPDQSANGVRCLPDQSANGAKYDSQGQARSASPLDHETHEASRPEGPKYDHMYSALSGLTGLFNLVTRGDVLASLRTCPWLSYSAPLALRCVRVGAAIHFPRRWRYEQGNVYGPRLL